MSREKSRASFISAQQVAELAGVSRSAVSRTFTPGASVSEETRVRVLKAANTLGYHVNHLARGLMRQQTGIVCLVVADIDTPYLSRMVTTLTRRLQEAGKVAMLINTAGARRNVEVALRQTLNYRADATVVLSGTPDPSIIRTCLDSGQRLVLINRDDHLESTGNLGVGNAAAARMAVHTFLRAGCRRLAVLSSGANTPSLLDRQRHFVEAGRAVGLDITVWHEGRTGYETGLAGAHALLSRPDRPDAVFCVTDLLACGFMDGARHDFGLAIPKDVCVIGFDDIEQAGWSSYRLTTFGQPVEEVAGQVVALIVAEEDDLSEGSRTFQAPFIWRSTVRGGQPSTADETPVLAG